MPAVKCNNSCSIRLLLAIFITGVSVGIAQSKPIQKVPDTGQIIGYTSTPGEDADYQINMPSYNVQTNGTVVDNITGLQWQRSDGGETTIEKAKIYCDTLTLGGYSDWRLPTLHELFSILYHGANRPAMDTNIFTKTSAEYWWSNLKSIDDSTKIWVTNAGGGSGAHLKNETISAGGVKSFHVKAVRNSTPTTYPASAWVRQSDGSILDAATGLYWTKLSIGQLFSWENALAYCESFTLGNYSDWRLPNIKELQSLIQHQRINPAIDTTICSVSTATIWSSTTLHGQTGKAWCLSASSGLVFYDDKTKTFAVLAVRGPTSLFDITPEMVIIPGGTFSMGDHHGFIDPQHPSDELPLHNVSVDSFVIGKYEITNQQYCDFLNNYYAQGKLIVNNNIVYSLNDTNKLYLTNGSAPYYSISFTGSGFVVADFRAQHPVVGVQWFGAIAYCNWLSETTGLQPVYKLTTGICDFTKSGYRLPTEAEWEFAGRGGQYNPYFVFPWGNDSTNYALANWPSSGDPYETGNLPYTTPVGFFNGSLQLKSTYNWPGTAVSYQTGNGSNAYGLYDMSGNVWEFVNDWYGQNYYSISPALNPTGPASGFIMPDGKPYRGMRGGNWYNGLWGHSRVANRNPSYYRGPQDPNHPWYHIGFRIVRKQTGINTVEPHVGSSIPNRQVQIIASYPNPFNPVTTIVCTVAKQAFVTAVVCDITGSVKATLYNGVLSGGKHNFIWNAGTASSGVYFCIVTDGNTREITKLVLLK